MSDQSSNQLLDAALQYAGRGWRVIPLHGIVNGTCTCKARAACPTPGKHPSIKTGRAFAGASTDPKTIHDWFRHANRNIGIATGNGILVIDVDGPEGLATLRGIAKSLPSTLMAQSGRPDGGCHLWFSCDTHAPTNSGGGLDCRGDGGLVVVPPSRHISGQSYKWLNAFPLCPVPSALLSFLSQRKGGKRQNDKSRQSPTIPDYLRQSRRGRIAELATAGMHEPPTDADLAALAFAIPNTDLGWDEWNRIGLAFYGASEGNESGLAAFGTWSAKSEKYSEETTISRWEHYHTSPPDGIGMGTLVYEARQARPDFQLPSRLVDLKVNRTSETNGTTPDTQSPTPNAAPPHHTDPPLTLQILNEFNDKYCVVKIGGKAIVMYWKPASWSPTLSEPVFMTFKSFADFYCNRYVTNSAGKEMPLGAYWLKWKLRKTFHALDLIPKGPTPAGTLNLWRGWAVEPKPGRWDRFKQHIKDVVAAGDVVVADYIMRWCAWAVQNPEKQAEVALVLRGGKGAGKGTFASTIQSLFGCHGLHISSSKHLTGHFNAILRDCLLLFADEAYWAGDKQGESSLKALLTEKTLMIEHKGLDPLPWRNRLHVIMAANADWAVPASHDERRFAVFDVVPDRAGDFAYFAQIKAELEGGGLAGLLHDLLAYDLKGWHPRDVVQTAALQKQKKFSLSPFDAFWAELLESGRRPLGDDGAGFYQTSTLYQEAARASPQLVRMGVVSFGMALADAGCQRIRREKGSFWHFPDLTTARAIWLKKFKNWKYALEIQKWY